MRSSDHHNAVCAGLHQCSLSIFCRADDNFTASRQRAIVAHCGAQRTAFYNVFPEVQGLAILYFTGVFIGLARGSNCNDPMPVLINGIGTLSCYEKHCVQSCYLQ